MEINITAVESFDEIEADWRRIDSVSSGQENYTFYQQADWNKYVDAQTHRAWRNRLGIKVNVFITASVDGQIIAIFPLLLTPLSRKIEFISWRSSGLNDLSSSATADSYIDQVALEMVKYLMKRYSGYKFKFYDVPATSPLIKAVEQLCTVRTRKPRGSFHIPLCNYSGYDGWFKSLSSHQRQNLRTLYNHVARDNQQINLRLFDSDNLPDKVYLRKVWNLYALRKIHWRKRGEGIFSRLTVAYNTRKEMSSLISRSLGQLRGARMFTLEVNGTIMAFLFCYCDNNGRIIVPKLAIHPDYVRFSPGSLLLCETLKWCYQHQITDFNLSRGDETYKRRFGGIEERILRLTGILKG